MHSSSSEYRLERAVKMKGDGEALQATPRLYFLGRPPEDLPALASQGETRLSPLCIEPVSTHQKFIRSVGVYAHVFVRCVGL